MSGYTTAPPPGAGGPIPEFDTVGGHYVLSGWWRRAGAACLDAIVVCGIALVLLVAITAPFSIGFFANDTVGVVAVLVGALLAVCCVAVVSFLYAPFLMARTNGKTLGRMAVGIRVVRANGQPMTFWFAMLREVVIKALLFGFVSSFTFGIASLLDVLWPLWDEENRALHDFIVNTRVIVD
jgi:uncharacterized RDD family membrane protein YckC